MGFIRKKLGGLSTAYSIRPLIFCLIFIFGLAACHSESCLDNPSQDKCDKSKAERVERAKRIRELDKKY